MNDNEYSAKASTDQSQPKSHFLINAPTLQHTTMFKDEQGRDWVRFYHTCGGWYEEPAHQVLTRFAQGKRGSIRERLIKFYRSRVLFGRPSLGIEATGHASYVYPGTSGFAWWSQSYA